MAQSPEGWAMPYLGKVGNEVLDVIDVLRAGQAPPLCDGQGKLCGHTVADPAPMPWVVYASSGQGDSMGLTCLALEPGAFRVHLVAEWNGHRWCLNPNEWRRSDEGRYTVPVGAGYAHWGLTSK